MDRLDTAAILASIDEAIEKTEARDRSTGRAIKKVPRYQQFAAANKAIAPARLQDYVIVHELAHLSEREHSAAFWSLAGRALPDYEQLRAALKRLGPELVW